jgi:hypothetical protein
MSNFLLAAKAKGWRLKTVRDKFPFLHGLKKNPSNPIKKQYLSGPQKNLCQDVLIFIFAVVGTRISKDKHLILLSFEQEKSIENMSFSLAGTRISKEKHVF